MRARLLGSAAWVLGLATAAGAQFPGGAYPGGQGYGGQGYGGGYSLPPYSQGQGFGPQQGGMMPNIYNPQTQPLSPYLNLFRGSNPATNYYYGVRPGTVGGGGMGGFGGAPNIAMGGYRPLFLPQLATGPDPAGLPAAEGTVFPPAGHPVMYGNTMGYFPGLFGRGTGMRPGLSGAANNRPATQTQQRR